MSKWLRGLQLSPLPSADTTAASTDTETRGGSQTTVETAVGEESCVDKCSADSSSLHCRRLTLPPPPLTPKRVAAAAPLSASAPPTPAVCTTVGCNHYLIDRQR